MSDISEKIKQTLRELHIVPPHEAHKEQRTQGVAVTMEASFYSDLIDGLTKLFENELRNNHDR